MSDGGACFAFVDDRSCDDDENDEEEDDEGIVAADDNGDDEDTDDVDDVVDVDVLFSCEGVVGATSEGFVGKTIDPYPQTTSSMFFTSSPVQDILIMNLLLVN